VHATLPTNGGSLVQAYLDGTSVHATGDLTIHAEQTGDINATVVAVAVALAGGGQTGIAVSAGGVYALNFVALDTKAYAKDADAIVARSIEVSAMNTGLV